MTDIDFVQEVIKHMRQRGKEWTETALVLLETRFPLIYDETTSYIPCPMGYLIQSSVEGKKYAPRVV